MSQRVKFTANRVAKFRCDTAKQQQIIWDSEASGLGLRATRSGAKSYIFETRLHRKTLRLTIGDIRDWPIDGPSGNTKTARAEARRLKTLTDSAIDPREQAAEQRERAESKKVEAARREGTVAVAWAAYILARKHKWSARHLADHETVADAGGKKKLRGEGVTAPGPLAGLMPLTLTQIDASHVKAWLSEEAAHRATRADLAFRLFRAFLAWCETTTNYCGIVPASARDSRIAKDVLPRKSPKQDCLQREQLPGWFAAVRAISNPTIAAYLQILLLTGARRESLAALTWENVDFRWLSITIRDKDESKGGADGMRTIPVTPYVANLLADLKRRNEAPPPAHRILHGKKIAIDLNNWKPSVWVFTSKTAKSGRLQDPTQQHYRARDTAAIEGLTLHGLRRSFATLSEWVEVPTGVVAQIMGHKPSATAERHYKRRPLDLLRKWHVSIEAWILDAGEVQFDLVQNGSPQIRAA
jgi:integrase